MFHDLLEKLARREDLTRGRGRGGDGRDHGRPRERRRDGRPPDGARDEGRAAARRSSAWRGRCASARSRCRRRTPTPSTCAARAAIGPARSTSRRSRRWSSRRAACAWPSTATGRCRAGAAARTCSRRSACAAAAPPTLVERMLDEAGMAFLFAPVFHPSMRHAAAGAPGARPAHRVQPARAADEPGAAARQIVGVPRPELTETDRPVAAAARVGARLGRARRGRPRRDLDRRIHEGVGVPRRHGEHVLRAPGGLRPAACARRRRSPAATRRPTRRSRARCWAARPGPPRDVVLLNAGAALLVAGRAATVRGRDRDGGPRRSTAGARARRAGADGRAVAGAGA